MTREQSKEIFNEHADRIVNVVIPMINEAASKEQRLHPGDSEIVYAGQAILETVIQKLEAKV